MRWSTPADWLATTTAPLVRPHERGVFRAYVRNDRLDGPDLLDRRDQYSHTTLEGLANWEWRN